MAKIRETDRVATRDGHAQGVVMCSRPQCGAFAPGKSALVRWDSPTWFDETITEHPKTDLVVIRPGGRPVGDSRGTPGGAQADVEAPRSGDGDEGGTGVARSARRVRLSTTTANTDGEAG